MEGLAIIFICFVICLVLGVPVGYSLALSGIAYIAATGTGSSRAAAEEDAISSIDLRPQKVTHLQLLSRRLQEGAGNEASHKGRTA